MEAQKQFYQDFKRKNLRQTNFKFQLYEAQKWHSELHPKKREEGGKRQRKKGGQSYDDLLR